MTNYDYDALFIGAHPDDVEIHAGGTIAKLTDQGRRVMILDLTLGEMGSRGTVEERKVEAKDAATVLKAERMNAELPDGRLQYEGEAMVRAIVEAIRKTKPRYVFTHPEGDHHPDHNAASTATRFATFQANVLRYETEQERHLAGRLFYYVTSRKKMPAKPDMIIDTTDTHERKKDSLKCYRSQLANDKYKGAETYVASDQAWRMIDIMAGFIGGLAGKTYGEGFTSNSALIMDDIFQLTDTGV